MNGMLNRYFHTKMFVALLVLSAFLCRSSKAESALGSGANVWLKTSLHQVFPKTSSPSGDPDLQAARNRVIAFPVGFTSKDTGMVEACDLEEAKKFDLTSRFGDLLPQRISPGTASHKIAGIDYLPRRVSDLLMSTRWERAGPLERRSSRIRLPILPTLRPLSYEFSTRLRYDRGKKVVVLPLKPDISSLVVPPRHNFYDTDRKEEIRWDYSIRGITHEEPHHSMVT